MKYAALAALLMLAAASPAHALTVEDSRVVGGQAQSNFQDPDEVTPFSGHSGGPQFYATENQGPNQALGFYRPSPFRRH